MSDPSTQGPVEFVGAEVVQEASFFEAESGSEVLFGGNWVENHGDDEVELRSARLVGDVDPKVAEVAEVRVLRQSQLTDQVEAWGVGNLAEPGPRDSWKAASPVKGFVLTPGEQTAVMFKVVFHDEDEVGRWSRTELTYSVDGRTHVTESNYGFAVCRSNDLCEGMQ